MIDREYEDWWRLHQQAVNESIQTATHPLVPVEETLGDAIMKAMKEMHPVEENKKDDKVYKPNHYAKWVIEPVTFIMKNRLTFEIGNIVKYAVRAGEKIYEGMDATQSEITDLRKAIRYAEMRINQLEGKDDL